jgi:diguanylate cyclase (GGDEF)-like protein
VSEIEAGFDLGEFASSSRLLCAITTRAGRVLWANDTLGRAFAPDAGAVINRAFVELIDPYDRAQAIREMTRLDEVGDEVAFTARLHPVAGGFSASWSWRVGHDGLLYVLGIEAEPAPSRPADDADGPDARELRELVALDRFKQYNDTFGHLAGDECLVTVARAIQQRASRTGELVGRFGGDEFLVLWPGIDVSTAQRNANRIRDAVRVLDLRIAEKPMHVSVSIGGITLVPAAETTAIALIHAADRAMYAVKRAGGDDTRWVTDPEQAHEGETATP